MLKKTLLSYLIVCFIFTGLNPLSGLTAGVAVADESIDHEISDWDFWGSAQAEYTLDKSTAHGGTYSLRLNNQSPYAPNVFYTAVQGIQVKPNTLYELSAWVKTENTSFTWFGGGLSWQVRATVAIGLETYDWQYKTVQYTTGPEETSFEFRILTEGTADHTWFDDMSMVEVGTTDNIIKNGDFEKKRLADVTSNQPSGEVLLGSTVQLNNTIAGVDILYTTDGSDPRTSVTKLIYAEPIPITNAMTIKAYATKLGMIDSNLTSFEYTIGTGVTGESYLGLGQYNNKLGGGKKAPILRANNIQIDGEFAEWSSYTGVKLPTNLETQVLPSAWSGESDLSADVKFAYDADFFYLAVKATDNVHKSYPNDLMWFGDSVQIAFSQDGMYGPEYAFGINDGLPQIWRYASGKATMDKDSVTYQVKRTGEQTIYEAKIPWLAIFDTKPLAGANIPFTILVNDDDNDGQGRGWTEWTAAIRGSKDPNELAELKLVSQEDEWMPTIEGKRGFVVNEENPFAVYVPNFSNLPLHVKVSSDFFNLVEQDVIIPAQSVWKKVIPVSLPLKGIYTADVSVREEIRGITKNDTIQLNITSNPNELLDRLNVLQQKLPALESLLASVEAQQISTDYEQVNMTVLKNFINYGLEDIDQAYLERAEYNINELEKLYAEAESDLHAYLTGTKTPLPVPRYISGNVEIEGNSFIADTKITGSDEIVRRPVFFTGYGHFGQAKQDIPQFTGYGTNVIQMEIGPNSVIVPKGGLADWNVFLSGGVQASALIDRTVSHSGQASVRLNNATPMGPQAYMNVYQTVAVKPNTTYEMKIWVKGEDVNNVGFTGDPSWGNRVSFPTGTYDWTEVTNSYTTKSDETQIQFIILSENVVGNVWMDDISFTEQGQIGNLIHNGDFEHDFVDLGSEDYVGDTAAIKNDVVRALENADEHNIAVNLLISPHYFPAWALEKWPELKSESVSFLQYNLNDSRVRAILEDYLRILIPLVKDYPSLQSITLSNESVYQSFKDSFNLPGWRQYLQSNYTDIQQLNDIYLTSYISFNDIPLPAGISRTPFFYDWVKFNNKLFSEWHQWMADIIHEMAPNIPLQAKVMNGGLSDIASMTWGIDSEQFAGFSEISGNDNFNYYGWGPEGFTSELKFYDFQASLKKAPIFNSEDHLIPDGDDRYIPEMASHVESVLWQGAVHGRGGSTIWVWERFYGDNMFKGSIMNRPDVVAITGKANLNMNRLAEEVTAFQNDEAKAAILYAMPSMIYSDAYPKAIDQAYEAISYSGLKVGFISEKQANEGGLAGIKVLFIPEVTHLEAETLLSLQQFVERGGKVVVTGSNSLKFDEHNQPLNESVRNLVMNNANTTRIASNTLAKQIRETVTPLLAELELNQVVLIDVATNLPVYETEWRSVWQNGRLLINIDNYSTVAKNVYIEVDGQRISQWDDLLSASAVTASTDDTLLLSPLQPHLLSLELEQIDNVVPTAAVTYGLVAAQSVIATITPSESVTITNNGGSSSYAFSFNGSFTFEFVDIAGNHGTATATVNNIVLPSKAKPGNPNLSDDNGQDTGIKDGNYNVTMNLWYGENARLYKLYENDVLIDTQILTDHSPAAQSAITPITNKMNGTYRYHSELTNAFGTTTSATHIVTVTKAAPDKSILSNDNWDGDGSFKVSMNLWWGTNGTTYNLYENGILIYTQALTNHTPTAQLAATTLTNRAKGTYEYQAELVNYAGTTSSEKMIVKVTK